MANRTRRTAKKDAKFFAVIATGRPVGVACKAAGYSRRSVYEYQKEDKDFARCWQEADDEAVELMEAEADRRAMKGTLEPVFYQGEKCGSVRKFSDGLLMFRLKGKRPHIYRETVEHSGPGGRPIQTEDVTFDDAARSKRIAALLDGARARRDRSATGGGAKSS